MKIKSINFVLIIMAVLVLSCKEEELSDPLTSVIWGKPKILHIPDNLGFSSSNLCAESYRFQKNGEYIFTEECSGRVAYAKWTWITEGEEMALGFGGKYPSVSAKRIKIVGISDKELHTIERIEGEPEGTGNYWEKIYKPR